MSRSPDWTSPEKRYIGNNDYKGSAWISENIKFVSGNVRSEGAIRRMASILGYKLAFIRSEKIGRATVTIQRPLLSVDDQTAQGAVKCMQEGMWQI